MMSDFTKQQKIELFRSFFSGLDNVYGTYDVNTSKARQVKEPVTDQVILDHLTGRHPFGVYLLIGNKIRVLAVDFDQEDLSFPVNFIVAACDQGLPAYIERSKSKGFHVWMFFQGAVLASKARLVAQKILSDMGLPNTEIFPKQDKLGSNISYGNFINAPLFGKLVVEGRTVFLDPDDPTQVYPDQWQFLKNVKRIRQNQLEAVIGKYGLDKPEQQNSRQSSNNNSIQNQGSSTFGLPPCIKKILSEGITYDQRMCTFRLAVNLKKAGLPLDLTVVTLIAWAQKNRPQNGKRIITEKEIKSQADYAYQKNYRSCGCEETVIANFCDDSCPLASQKNGG